MTNKSSTAIRFPAIAVWSFVRAREITETPVARTASVGKPWSPIGVFSSPGLGTWRDVEPLFFELLLHEDKCSPKTSFVRPGVRQRE